MIRVNYKDDGILVEANELEEYFSSELLPLRVDFTRRISGKVLWSSKISSRTWTSFPNKEIVDTIIFDSKGNEVFRYNWNVVEHGNYLYRRLWSYCKDLTSRGIRPKGIAVGTHDGDFGEWIPVAMENISDIVLVEASSPQFTRLKINYSKIDNVKLLQELITSDGRDVVFYEGGQGYTNSIVEEITKSWEEKTAIITETKRKSVKFQDIIDSVPGLNWIHLDVEGIDDELLYSISDESLSNLELIIFEYNVLSTERRSSIDDYLVGKGFTTYREKGICLAWKK